MGNVADPLSAYFGESESASLDVGIQIYPHVDSPSFLSVYLLFYPFLYSFPSLLFLGVFPAFYARRRHWL